MSDDLKPFARRAAGRGDDAPPRSDVEALRGRLVRFAMKLIWNHADAEEIAQEAFAVGLARGKRPESSADAAWMFRTVANLCLNRRRRRKTAALDIGDVQDERESPESAASRRENLERLRLAIEELPSRQRVALVLRTMEMLDYDAISEIMQLSISAVRAHVHLARRRLVERLGDVSDRS